MGSNPRFQRGSRRSSRLIRSILMARKKKTKETELTSADRCPCCGANLNPWNIYGQQWFYPALDNGTYNWSWPTQQIPTVTDHTVTIKF